MLPHERDRERTPHRSDDGRELTKTRWAGALSSAENRRDKRLRSPSSPLYSSKRRDTAAWRSHDDPSSPPLGSAAMPSANDRPQCASPLGDSGRARFWETVLSSSEAKRAAQEEAITVGSHQRPRSSPHVPGRVFGDDAQLRNSDAEGGPRIRQLGGDDAENGSPAHGPASEPVNLDLARHRGLGPFARDERARESGGASGGWTNQCTQCLANFGHRSSLYRHIRTMHGRTYSFQCNLCHFTFREKGALEKHYRVTHERRRPFVCNLCDSVFQQRAHLEGHTKTVHLKQRPHRCNHCNASFGQKPHLVRHIRTVHDKIRPYRCELCGLNFSERRSLENHRRSKHDVTLPSRTGMSEGNPHATLPVHKYPLP